MSLADVAYRVRGHQAEVLRDLIDRPACSPDRLFEQLYGADPDGGPESGYAIIRRFIFEVRRKLRPGWRIVWVDSTGVPAIKKGGCMWKLEEIAR